MAVAAERTMGRHALGTRQQAAGQNLTVKIGGDRWILILLGGAMVGAGLVRRTPLALAAAAGGTYLAWRGIGGFPVRCESLQDPVHPEALTRPMESQRRHWDREPHPPIRGPGTTTGGAEGRSDTDSVEEASEESFPASDAPGWTRTSAGGRA